MTPLGPLSRVVPAIALVLVAGVSLARGYRLAADGFRPNAVGEQRWFGWAYGNGEEHRRLATLGRRTPAGARLYLELPSPDPDQARRLRMMAPYELPAAEVSVAPSGEGGPPLGARPVALPEPEPKPPSERWSALTALAGGLALALVVGLPLVLRGPLRGRADDLDLPALSLVVGTTGMVPPLLVLRFSGVALSPPSVLVTGLAVAAAFALARGVLGPPGTPTPAAADGSGLLAWAAWGVLALAFAVFAWKVDLAPLWSWDHFAIWGMKARRLAAGGAAPPDFLAGPSAASTVPWYPLGLPVGWLALSLGYLPGTAFFKAAHLLFAGAMLLLVRGGARAAGADGATSTTAAALIAVSPLLWDTESLGLADLPTSLWVVAAVVVALRSRAGPPKWGAVAGLLAGFLPWIKQDGWALCGLLVAATSALFLLSAESRRRPAVRIAWFAAPAAVTAAGAAGAARLWLGQEVSWLAGDWWGRVVDRVPTLGEFVLQLGADLARPEWFGFWLLFAAAWLAAAVRRRRIAFVVGAVVVAQIAVYAAVFLATYLPPADHIRSAFFRLSAALAPLAAVALAAALGTDETPRLE